ncbi:MAG: hypothetical protein JWO31_243 [Phycisphaerales bacterium]|nr:hypothetical protein [Phycisphaerales bacterium]
MPFEQDTMFDIRYARFVQSLPMVCPPVAPTIVGITSLAVIYAFGVAWPALILGMVLLALVPQWDSCVFRLMDFTTCALLLLTGLLSFLRLAAG